MTDPAGRARTSARTKARKRALDILFEAELRGVDPLATLAERTADADPPVREFTTLLVEGVVAHRAAIDERIGAALSRGWSLERMPRVDRNLVRIATYELTHTETSPRVAIAEAVGLAQELSTDESPGFVNGVLTQISTPDQPPEQI